MPRGDTVDKPVNHTVEYFRSIGWVLLLIYLFLGLLAFIFGRIVGFSLAIWCCVGLGMTVTIVFVSIILFNITCIGVVKILRYIFISLSGDDERR